MSFALDGVRVLELARYQAGPRGGMILSDLGAQIGQDHAAARPGLITSQLENAHTVESEAHFEAFGKNL